jgi:hypothetical protein
MKLYLKKIPVEALEWTGRNCGEVLWWCPKAYFIERAGYSELHIKHEKGDFEIPVGWMLIKDDENWYFQDKALFDIEYKPYIEERLT